MKILMVCLGNICRSPLAEGVLRSKLPDNFIVDSAGTANYHVGDSPDKRSILVAQKHGIDISQLRGRQFSLQDFKNFDLIYAMDNSNLKDIVNLAKNKSEVEKVKLLMSEAINSKTEIVPDPYYGEMEDFECAYQLIDEACEGIADRLLK